jgi:PleD family two-component response regulator
VARFPGQPHVQGLFARSGSNIRSKLVAGAPRLIGHAAIEEKAEPLAIGTGSGMLVVKEDNEARAYVAETLSELNYQVVEAAYTERAIEVFNDQKFQKPVSAKELASKIREVLDAKVPAQ